MKITVPVDGGEPIEFECADHWASRWVSNAILSGKTYPYLSFLDDVHVIVDAGANCGATTVHFARHYPEAEIHAFEPARETFGYLERNVAVPHARGARTSDRIARGSTKRFRCTTATVTRVWRRCIRETVNLEGSEMVQLRAAGAWAAEQGIDRIDILKVDVEGCEIEVLESLAEFLPMVKVCYLEYDSRQARRDIARLLDPTHELYIGCMFLDQGECRLLAEGPGFARRGK